MTFGQRLEVKNLTKDSGRRCSSRQPGSALMMATPNGDPVKLYPKQPVASACAITIASTPSPISSSSSSAARRDRRPGHYRIDGVPVGKLKVTVTHPYIADVAATKEVDIREGVVTPVNLMLHNKPVVEPDAGKPDATAPYPGLH